jgi:Lon protease-like protein
MFPLGTVLLPSVALPLQVFEPRYLALVRDCLTGGGELGVVLIERGSEVGGGETRFDVGTRAGLADVTALGDSRLAVTVVGRRRIRVRQWLPDDPYPRANVEDWPDPPPGPDHPTMLAEVTRRLRRALGLAAELGDPVAPAAIELSADPLLAAYQATAVAPLGPWDRQQLLACATPDQRLAELVDRLDEAIDLLELRLRAGRAE